MISRNVFASGRVSVECRRSVDVQIRDEKVGMSIGQDAKLDLMEKSVTRQERRTFEFSAFPVILSLQSI